VSLRITLRGLMRRDFLIVCFIIFSADLVSGILSPTFSLYAQNLGASLAFIGTLSSIAGVTQLLTSLPAGVLSDRHGRRIVLTLGMLAFAAATTLFALAPNALLLIPGRILLGLAGVATFSIGAAYVGDVVSDSERGVAYGLYTTSMGLGFGIGPLIGAGIAEPYGVPASYLAAAGLALCGAALAGWGLARNRAAAIPSAGLRGRQAHGATIRLSLGLMRDGFAWMLHDPRLLAGSLCNLLINTGFNGAISNFFPIYAADQHASQETINAMFSVRAFVSAAARLPSGAITSRLPSRAVMAAALLLATSAIFLMARTNALVLLGALLIVEGISFGMFLPSGQAFTAENSTPATRGQVLGAYGTAGSLGSALSPLLLGVVAEAWGAEAVFVATAALMAVGLAAALALFGRRRSAG
jgi:MFS family permease